jgi:transcriptional regulator of acetoin/glycerol metabolism
MFTMRFDITVGDWRLGMVEKVEVRRSVEQLSDTATITLPAMVEGKALQVEGKLRDYPSENVPVTIRLGYNGSLETEFEGFLKTVATDGGNLTLVAKELGISRPTLYARLKKYGI